MTLALAASLPVYAAPEISFQLQLKYEEAQKLLDSKEWPEAAIVLRRIIEEAPRYAPAAIDLARALVYAGRREEALSILSAASEREQPNRPDRKREVLIRRARVISRAFLTMDSFQIYQEGINFLQAKKFRNANERFEVVLKREPDNVEVLQRLGQCALIDGDFDSASERFKLARKLNPWQPEIRLWLGRALQQRGELAAAVNELQDAFTSLPNSELAAVWLADAWVASGKRALIIPMLERHLKTNPLHVQALLELARQRYFQEPQSLWSVRRELQLAMSRIELYAPARTQTSEGELGVDLRDAVTLKSEIEALLQRVEAKQMPASEPSSAPEPL